MMIRALTSVGAALDAVAGAADRATASVERVRRISSSEQRSDVAFKSLLDENSFGYLLRGWIEQAANNPDNPDLNEIEKFLREWTPQGRTINFMAMRRLLRDKRRALGLRPGQSLSATDTALALNLDEVTGR